MLGGGVAGKIRQNQANQDWSGPRTCCATLSGNLQFTAAPERILASNSSRKGARHADERKSGASEVRFPGRPYSPAVKVVVGHGGHAAPVCRHRRFGLWWQHSLQMAAEARQAADRRRARRRGERGDRRGQGRAAEATAKVALEQAKVAEAMAAKTGRRPSAAVAAGDAEAAASKHGHHHGGGSAKGGSKALAKAGCRAGATTRRPGVRPRPTSATTRRLTSSSRRSRSSPNRTTTVGSSGRIRPRSRPISRVIPPGYSRPRALKLGANRVTQ